MQQLKQRIEAPFARRLGGGSLFEGLGQSVDQLHQRRDDGVEVEALVVASYALDGGVAQLLQLRIARSRRWRLLDLLQQVRQTRLTKR